MIDQRETNMVSKKQQKVKNRNKFMINVKLLLCICTSICNFLHVFFALLSNVQKMGLLLVIFSYKKKCQNYDMKHIVLALNRQQQPNHYQNFLTVAGKTINSFLCSSIKVIIFMSHGVRYFY